MARLLKPIDPQTEQSLEKLRFEVARLQSALAESRSENKEAAQRASYFAGQNEETPTGRTVSIKRAKNPWVKNADDLKYETVELPTFLYTIDMVPVGGVQILLDGEALQQGQTYEMTLDRLRVVKEIVHRLRAHEAAIHGSDEDKFRPRISKEICLKTGQMRNLPPNWMPGAGSR
jgi:hypothetical protein